MVVKTAVKDAEGTRLKARHTNRPSTELCTARRALTTAQSTVVARYVLDTIQKARAMTVVLEVGGAEAARASKVGAGVDVEKGKRNLVRRFFCKLGRWGRVGRAELGPRRGSRHSLIHSPKEARARILENLDSRLEPGSQAYKHSIFLFTCHGMRWRFSNRGFVKITRLPETATEVIEGCTELCFDQQMMRVP